jgi:small conductance mechanosensitive channel
MNETTMEHLARLWAGMGSATTIALRVALILTAAWVISTVVQRAIRAFRERIAARLDDPEAVKRAETLGRVLRYVVKTVVWVLATMVVLGELGVSLAPILGAAGVVGLAVGFGAQSLVRDYFTGLTILFENQIRVGDVVNLGGQHAGVVEQVTLRFVQLRDYEGRVHYVPNGQITSIINMTRGFAHAVMDIGVAYRENTDEVMAVMREVARELRADTEFAPRILDDLEIAGVDQWADSAVVIRCRIRCNPGDQWTVRREYLRRLKHAFDSAGIEIPFPHVTVYAGQDRQGRAAALPLRWQGPHRALEAADGVHS